MYYGCNQSLGGVGGYMGSRALASIMYQTSLGNFVYAKDSSNNIVLDNQGNLGQPYDANIYSGRGLELLSTNNLSIPIHHTLGAEKVSNGDFTTDTLWTKGTGWTIGSGVATSDGSATNLFQAIATETIGNIVMLTFDVTSYTSGSFQARANTSVLQNANITGVGTYTLYFISDGTYANILFYNNASFIGSIDNVSVKQISNPSSYLTYYDFSKSGFVTLGNSVDGGSSIELVENYNTHTDNTAWSVGTVSNELDGFTKIVYGAGTNSNFYFRAINSEFKSDLIVGKSYRIKGQFKTDETSSFPKLNSSLDLGDGNTSASDGVVTFDKTFVATSTTSNSLSCYCDVGTRTVYWKIDSIQEILPISTTYTLNTKTANNFLTHTTPWSASDWIKINNNPNLVGKLALETTGVTKTIPELDMVMDAGASADKWYPCSESSGGYVVDARAGYGANLLNNTAPTVSNLDEITTFSSNTNNDFNLAVTTIGTSTAYPRVNNSSTVALSIGKVYVHSFDVVVNSGTPILTQIRFGSSSDILTPNETLTTKTYYFISKVSVASGTDTKLIFSGLNLFSISVTNWKVREASAQEISSYAATIRTNADFSQKGLQTTAFVQDGAGVPTAYSSNLLQFNGDGRYVDTKMMPPSDKAWEIDFVMNCLNDGQLNLSGCSSATASQVCRFGHHSSGGLYGTLGSLTIGSTTTVVSDGVHYIRIEFNGSGGGNFVIDNVTTYPFVGSDYTYTALESIFLGVTSRAGAVSFFPHTKPIGTYQYKLGTRTAAERNAYYAQLKTIYPSLP